MGFNLSRIQEQLAAAPLASPYPHDLAVAVICDTFRRAGVKPPSLAAWGSLSERFRHPLWKEQVGILAYVLASTALREETVRVLRPDFDGNEALQRFFEAVSPLTAEMVRANAFRQEEFLRRWVECVGGEVEGERPRESKRRLEQLDYRRALKEYERAEAARKAEAEARRKRLEEAQRRAADARGWRE
ncbi:MAG TPA: hypothetical protein VLQ93_01320 [Myxococcaceae bacterium]|nr:hypothetical protein [Myxococcaceae bacterium]